MYLLIGEMGLFVVVELVGDCLKFVKNDIVLIVILVVFGVFLVLFVVFVYGGCCVIV